MMTVTPMQRRVDLYRHLQSVARPAFTDPLRRAKCDVLVENVVAVFGRHLEGPVPVPALGVHQQSGVEVDAGQLTQRTNVFF